MTKKVNEIVSCFVILISLGGIYLELRRMCSSVYGKVTMQLKSIYQIKS